MRLSLLLLITYQQLSLLSPWAGHSPNTYRNEVIMDMFIRNQYLRFHRLLNKTMNTHIKLETSSGEKYSGSSAARMSCISCPGRDTALSNF